jgi:pimeloyl-ACP methyl ester carboxylesterase
MLRLVLSFLLLIALPQSVAHTAEPWQSLPPTPAPIAYPRSGPVSVNGIRLFYGEIGSGPPVLMLHGGLANSDYFGHQVRALADRHRVIVVDSRGHGRSTRDDRPFGYDLMADDVVALLDVLAIAKPDIVGWSDGGIIALDIAMRHPNRVGRIFAFGANTSKSGLKDDFDQNPVFAAYIKRAGEEYARISPTPTEYEAFLSQIGRMWASEPNWSDDQLKTIRSPVMVADGEHDEGIKLEHTEYMAATIPGARILIMPGLSHFAFLQDPERFNAALLQFLGDR